VADLTQPVALDTEAHLLAWPLRAGVELSRVELEAIANDCIFASWRDDLEVTNPFQILVAASRQSAANFQLSG